MEHTVIHDEKVDRFEVFESGQIAYLQYDLSSTYKCNFLGADNKQ